MSSPAAAATEIAARVTTDHRDRRYPCVESVIMRRVKHAGGRGQRDSLFVKNRYPAFGSPPPHPGGFEEPASGVPAADMNLA
jgi:hypothetical protein